MKNLDEVINQLGRKIDQQIPTDSSMSRLKRNQLIVVGLYKAASSISSKDAGNDFKLVTSLTRLLEGYVVKLDDTAVDDLYREKRDQLIPVESDTKGGNSNYIVSLRTSLRKNYRTLEAHIGLVAPLLTVSGSQKKRSTDYIGRIIESMER